MSLYRAVITSVERAGIRGVATCHIAHVLAYYGLTKRVAANRIYPNSRVKPCPPEKWRHIEDALRELGVLERRNH